MGVLVSSATLQGRVPGRFVSHQERQRNLTVASQGRPALGNVKATAWVCSMPCTQALCSAVSIVCGWLARSCGNFISTYILTFQMFAFLSVWFVWWLALQAFHGASALYSSLQQLSAGHAIFVTDEELAMLATLSPFLMLTYHMVNTCWQKEACKLPGCLPNACACLQSTLAAAASCDTKAAVFAAPRRNTHNCCSCGARVHATFRVRSALQLRSHYRSNCR